MYGTGTRSYNRSTEARQMKQEVADIKAKVELGELVLMPPTEAELRNFLICECRSFRYRHTLDAHQKLRSEYDWRIWQVRERDTLQVRERPI